MKAPPKADHTVIEHSNIEKLGWFRFEISGCRVLGCLKAELLRMAVWFQSFDAANLKLHYQSTLKTREKSICQPPFRENSVMYVSGCLATLRITFRSICSSPLPVSRASASPTLQLYQRGIMSEPHNSRHKVLKPQALNPQTQNLNERLKTGQPRIQLRALRALHITNREMKT